MIGKTLAHYEITSQIGKGGMGEVYQAKDQKLGRDVAIKVLPEEFAKDTDRVARFQREAKLLASLNHPNIAAIHGLEEVEGTNFLVMELVEGQTLDDRIKSGPIPVEEALKLALQIAEALEAAHEKGVIHRDLKPANIKVTPDDKVKVLDFGLAKAFAGEQADLNLSNSPTLSVAATQQGLILGTAAYMSPEQTRGKEVDKRADIWAFGVVLFEMLTGKQVFTGDTVSDTLASVLAREPEWESLPQNLHPRIRLLLERCLKKDPKNRYHDIADARVDIQEVLADPSGVFLQPSTIAKPGKKLELGILWIAATVVVASIIVGIAVWRLKPPEPHQVTRTEYELPEGQRLTINSLSLAISPDGKQFAYSTINGLYLRSMDDWTAKLLTGTEGAIDPFFSPDSQWIGFYSKPDRKLKKISIDGDAPLPLCDLEQGGGFSWTSDKRILQGFGSEIRWVSDEGGDLETLFKEEYQSAFDTPQMLPDGKSVLFTRQIGNKVQIMVHSLQSGKSQELPIEGGSAQYIKTGHIVFGAENNLYAVPFDSEKLQVTGGRRFLVGGVLNVSTVWHYAVSDSGTLVYTPSQSTGIVKRKLIWVDRDEKEETIIDKPEDYRDVKISPDRTQIAMSIFAGGNQDIHIWDIERGTEHRLTFETLDDGCPVWAPDSKSIIYTSMRTDGSDLYRKTLNGTGEVETILSLSKNFVWSFSWSSDGKTLALFDWNDGNADISMLSMEGDRKKKLLLEGKYAETHPMFSPEGKWMAFVSRESGLDEVWVGSFPDVKKGSTKVSMNGGTNPLWSRDGKELFYWTNDALMVVPVETDPTFTKGTSEVLFERTPVSTDRSLGLNRIPYDINNDGTQFLMLKPADISNGESESGIPRKINIVLNWFEELKEKAPVD